MRSLFTLKILGIHFLFLALPLILNSFLYFQEFYRSSIKRAKAELEEIAILRTYALSELEPESEAILNSVAYFLEQEGHEPGFENKLRELGHIQPLREYLYFQRDEKGYRAVLASQKQNEGKYARAMFPVEKLALHRSLAFLSYQKLDGETEEYVPLLMTARGVTYSEGGEPLTILVQEAKIAEPLKEILSNEKFTNVHFAVLNAEGVVFTATDSNFIGNFFYPLSPRTLEEIQKEGTLGEHRLAGQPIRTRSLDEPGFLEFYFNGETQLAFIAEVEELDFSMLVYQSKNILFDKALRHFFWIYALFLLVILIGGLLAFWLALWIARPLRQLSYLMGAVSDGKYDQHFEPQPLGFEINILGEIFNSTLDSLLSNIEKEKEESVKKELLRSEIDLSREVQENLLTVEQPKVAGIESSLVYMPGKEVAGSFHLLEKKFYKEGQEYLLLALASPRGVGISSVLYSLTLRSLLRGTATVTDVLDGMLKTINTEFLKKSSKEGFEIDAFVAFIEPSSRQMEYINCGMPLPWIEKEGRLEKLGGAKATSFGASYFATPGSQIHTFEEGERLFLFSSNECSRLNSLSPSNGCSLKEQMERMKKKFETELKEPLNSEVIGLGVDF
jgi:phosphoserine phosphatase RsbU/P